MLRLAYKPAVQSSSSSRGGGPSASSPGWGEGWLLALSLRSSTLTCFLSDGHSRFEHAEGPWPVAAGAEALPAAVRQAIAQGPFDALRLQLDADLDTWPWEAELDQARAGLRVSRHIGRAEAPSGAATAAPLGTTARQDPSWVHEAASDWPGLASAQQRDGLPLVAVLPEVPAARAARFRAELVARWDAEPSLAAAATIAAAEAGLARSEWRLYGEARFEPAASPAQEWRQVTSVSIDLVQSTSLLLEWGAERYAHNHGVFYALCRQVVGEHEGRVDDPQGDDGLMAYFGLLQAREDAAVQAVRAASELAAQAPAIGFDVRIGITTGRVAVRDGLAFGDVIHLAARLQRIAPRNGIVISDATHALLGPGVACERLPAPLQLAGFGEPQAAWQVLRVDASQAVHYQRSGDGVLVGRQRELAALQEAWFVVRTTRRGQYRCLLGEPGIGKTRLLLEFERALRGAGDAVAIMRVTGHRELQSSAFAALAVGLEDTAPKELADLLLRARQAQSAADGGADRNELLRVLVDGCLQFARRTPLCLLVDDGQWLDPSTIDFIQRLRLAGDAVPLLLVVSLREDARGAARGLYTYDAITLPALDARECMDLIGSLARGTRLTAEARSLIAERTGGIPLFVEETVRMVGQLQDGVLHGIPATLEDLLMARLDALGAAKPMAQLAAVLGAEFPMSLWREVLADEDEWIARACAGDAWQRLVDAGVLAVLESDPPRCRFRHALIRDAAYDSLWRDDRRRLHRVVAQVLQAQDVHGRAALRAHHLAEAGDSEAACEAWTQAAREAAAAGADREALALSQRALDLLQQLPATPALRAQALQLHLLQAARAIALDGYGAATVEAAYLRAAALCTDAEAASMRLRVDLGLEACYAMRGDLQRARLLVESALPRAPWDDSLRLALQARWAWAHVVFHQGEVTAFLAMADECLGRYDPTLHHRGAVQDPAIMFLCYSAWGLFQQGRADEARVRVRRALELARTLDHPFSEAIAHGFAASIALFCGDHAEGLQHAEEAIRRCSAKAFQAWLAHAQVMRGRLRAALGEVDAGLADMEEALALWTATGARITAATYLSLHAEVLLECGEPEAALRKLVLAQDIAQQHGERYWEAELLRLRGWAQWQLRSDAAGGAAAQGLLQRGLALARKQGNLGFALRGALALGRTWVEEGDSGRAILLLDEAMQALPGHDATLDGRTARATRSAWTSGHQEQR